MKNILLIFTVAGPLCMIALAFLCANLDVKKHRILVGGLAGIFAVLTFGVCFGVVIFGVK